ncbi:MAG: peptide-methionine (R)-S-oxide reductase MsrB [Limisphaera sp.]|nr:peptide-methionine (R)-S-oxide reductase MsrB [Limisphaera sp.]
MRGHGIPTFWTIGLLTVLLGAEPAGLLHGQPITNRPGSASPPRKKAMDFPIKKTDAEWRAQLTPEQYRILRQKGTEPAFSGAYWNHKEKGVYRCAGCGAVLFTSDTKYDSGCGWPSYYAPASPDAIVQQPDYSHGMIRTEVLCAKCGGHLGHVFPDGPRPTGLRYCINSAALRFEKAVDAKR